MLRFNANGIGEKVGFFDNICKRMYHNISDDFKKHEALEANQQLNSIEEDKNDITLSVAHSTDNLGNLVTSPRSIKESLQVSKKHLITDDG